MFLIRCTRTRRTARRAFNLIRKDATGTGKISARAVSAHNHLNVSAKWARLGFHAHERAPISRRTRSKDCRQSVSASTAKNASPDNAKFPCVLCITHNARKNASPNRMRKFIVANTLCLKENAPHRVITSVRGAECCHGLTRSCSGTRGTATGVPTHYRPTPFPHATEFSSRKHEPQKEPP